MNGYFYTLLVASVCGAICAMLATGGFEKYIKYIASLVCVCLMIMPLREIDVSGIADSETAFFESSADVPENKLCTEVYALTEARAEEYISQIVFSEFGIKAVYADIKIDWTSDEPIIESITLALPKGDYGAEEQVGEYLFRTLGGEVNIVEV